mgnify:CR=1 FL=1
MSDGIQLPISAPGAEKAEQDILDLADALKIFQTQLKAASQAGDAGKEALLNLARGGAVAEQQAKAAAAGTKQLADEIKKLKSDVSGQSTKTASFLKSYTQESKEAADANSKFMTSMNESPKSLKTYQMAMHAAGVSSDEFAQATQRVELAQQKMANLSTRLGNLQKKVLHPADSTKLPQYEKQIASVNKKIANQGEQYYIARGKLANLQAAISQTVAQAPAGFDKMAASVMSFDARLQQSKDYLAALRQEADRAANAMAKAVPGTPAYAQASVRSTVFSSALSAEQSRINAARLAGVNTGAIPKAPAGNSVLTSAAVLANLQRLGMISPTLARATNASTIFAGAFASITPAMVAGTAGIIGGVLALKAITLESAKAAIELQKYTITLQSLSTHGWDAHDKSATASIALGTATAKAMMEYGASSSYALSKLAEGTEKMVGYGIDMRIVNKEMEMLGDLALGDSSRMEHLAIAYGQVYGQGKARAQELYQFVNAGIPIMDMLATKLGVTTSAVMDMTRNGEISFGIIRDVLKEATAEGGRYHDLMKKITGMSVGGQWTMFQNQIKLMFKDMGDNMLPALTNILTAVNRSLHEARALKESKDMYKTYKELGQRSEYGAQHAFDAYTTSEIADTLARDKRSQEITGIYGNAAAYTGGWSWRKSSPGMTNLIQDIATGIASPGSTELPKARDARLESLHQLMLRIGFSEKQIQDFFRNTVYDGRDISANTDVSTMIQNNTPLRPISPQAAQGVVTSNILSGSLVPIFNDLERGKISDPEYRKRLQEEYAKRIQAEKEAEQNLLKNAGAKEDDDKRKFALDEYIAKLKEEKENLKELVPLYAEYARIAQMAAEDQAAASSGKHKGEVMDKTSAQKKIEEAQALYKEVEARKLIQNAYGEMYQYAGTSNKPMTPLKYDEIQLVLAEYKKKWAEDHTGSTERENPYQNEDAVIKLIMASSAAGTDPQKMFEAVQKANRTLHRERYTSTSAGGLAAENYEDLQKMYSGLMGGVKLTETDLQFLKEIGNLHDASFGDEVLDTIDKYKNSLDGAARKVDVLRYALKKLKEDPATRTRDIINAEKEALQESAGVFGVGDIFSAMTGAGINTTRLFAPETYARERALANGTSNRASAGINNALNYFASGNDTTDLADRVVGTFSGAGVGHRVSAQAAAELNAVQANLEKARSATGLSPEDYAAGIKKAEEASSAAEDKFTNLGKALMVVAEAFGKIKDLAVDAVFKTLDTTMYNVGRSVSEGADAWDGYKESLKAIASELLNQVPTILMQAASGVLVTTGGTGWPLALGLMTAALGTSFLNGVMGTKEEAKEESDTDEAQILSNLQQQLAVMIDQMRASMAYLEVARAQYAIDAQADQVTAYARGDVFPGSTGLAQGVYNQPTFFRFAHGGAFSGVLGEAGEEAIMPLERTASGELGVKASGAGSQVNIIVNNNAPGVTVDVQERETDTGRELTLMVEQMVAGAIAGGSADSVMAARFGLKRGGRG